MIRLQRHQVLVDPIYDSNYFNPSTQLIQIPEYAKDRCDQGTVLYKGEDVDPSIGIGNHVIFSGYTGTTIGIDGKIYILMHYKFIKAMIEVDNYPVAGLYFKAKIKSEELENELWDYLSNYENDRGNNPAIDTVMMIFAKYMNNIMIPAQYESIFPLINQAFDQFIAPSIKVKKEEFIEQHDPFDGDK